MNILIKLTCLIGLVIAPILGGHSLEETSIENTNTIEVTSPEKTQKVVELETLPANKVEGFTSQK